MLGIKIICVGKLKEKFFAEAAYEYSKRLSSYCRLEIEEIAEVRISESPSPGELEAALLKEALLIEQRLPRSAALIAMCIEGEMPDSARFAVLMDEFAQKGFSRLCFIIGGSNGLHNSIKDKANLRLSMSRMTFPHHLARVILLEQIYRGFKIAEGSKYHK